MIKPSILLVAVLLIAACIPVGAARYTVPVMDLTWSSDTSGLWTATRTPSEWAYKSGGIDVEELTVQCPSGTDPRVRQNIKNNTVGDIWTDWHVSIVGGENLRGISVYKVGENTPWAWEFNPTGVGFFAHIFSTGDPENPMAVRPGDWLYVEFTYDQSGTDAAIITQYPTTTYPIPEPGSIVALLMGMGTFGFAALRRGKR